MTSKGPVDAKFDQLMDVLSNAMHLEVQLDRRMGRFLEKRTIALRHLTKVSEFFRIPEKFPIKEGKVYLDQEFLAKCFMNRLDWERRGVTQGFQPKSSSDATDFRNFNGILYDATSADLTARRRKHHGTPEAYGERVCSSPGATIRDHQRILHRSRSGPTGA